MMPSATCRSFPNGCPRQPAFDGSSGGITDHCASLNRRQRQPKPDDSQPQSRVNHKRVRTDNGSCYRSHVFATALADKDITHKRTRPYRPQTNGKVERFHRTLADEWAYSRVYLSDTDRPDAFAP